MKLSEHVPGTPCWVDLGSPDLKAATEFYSGLFGWDAQTDEEAGEEAEGYVHLMLDGRPAAGLGALTETGAESRWTVYVQVADADAVSEAVRTAGGTVRIEPMDILDLGRAAHFTDPGGGEFAVWQPGTFRGAEVLDEPGALCWVELNTRDDGAALGFYGSVFGWSGETRPFGGSTYTEVEVAGRARSFGGILRMNEVWPPEVPEHWMVYFEVTDCDAAATRTTELGGRLSVAPFDLENVGRIAVVEDPFGAFFSVISSNRAA